MGVGRSGVRGNRNEGGSSSFLPALGLDLPSWLPLGFISYILTELLPRTGSGEAFRGCKRVREGRACALPSQSSPVGQQVSKGPEPRGANPTPHPPPPPHTPVSSTLPSISAPRQAVRVESQGQRERPGMVAGNHPSAAPSAAPLRGGKGCILVRILINGLLHPSPSPN